MRIPAILIGAFLAGCSSSVGGSAPPLAPSAPAHAAQGGRVAGATRQSPKNGFAGTRIAFEHSLIADNGALISKYSGAYGIGTIFVPVANDDIISFLASNPNTIRSLNALSSVASVYIVTGDVSWLNNPTSVPSDVTSLIKIASMYPKFKGVLYAVDPEQSPAWNTGKQQAIMQQYFTLEQTLLSAPGASSFKTTQFLIHGDFATLKYGTAQNSPTMLAQLQSSSQITGFDMVAPGNSASSQLAGISAAIPALTKPFWIEASTSKYSKASYYGVTQSYLQSNLSQLQQTVSSRNALLAGIEVNGWNDLYNGLQSVLPQPPVFNGILPGGPLVPATGTTYLGAYVNPTGSGSTPKQTAAFETQIGRPLAYNMHFYGWKEYFPKGEDSDDVAHGRVPLIAWNCGDSDANVAAGKDDAIITLAAQRLKKFGSPVFVRWFWEMNLDETNNPPRTQCYDTKTDLANGYFSPTQYIAAWNRIHQIFVAQGATNVVWLWCVANAHGGPAQYYPGDSVVDWVGMDDYDTNDVSLYDTLYILSNELGQFQQKPFMITETGAHAANQSTFLVGAAAELKSQFPQARAIGYLDSQGSFQNWVLTTTGLSDFKTFAHDPYMSAMASPALVR